MPELSTQSHSKACNRHAGPLCRCHLLPVIGVKWTQMQVACFTCSTSKGPKLRQQFSIIFWWLAATSMILHLQDYWIKRQDKGIFVGRPNKNAEQTSSLLVLNKRRPPAGTATLTCNLHVCPFHTWDRHCVTSEHALSWCWIRLVCRFILGWPLLQDLKHSVYLNVHNQLCVLVWLPSFLWPSDCACNRSAISKSEQII